MRIDWVSTDGIVKGTEGGSGLVGIFESRGKETERE